MRIGLFRCLRLDFRGGVSFFAAAGEKKGGRGGKLCDKLTDTVRK